MAPKRKAVPEPGQEVASKRLASTISFTGRNGLGAYIADPKAFPASRVIYHNDDFVAINDLYPKATVHTLLLPRSPRKLLHPFDAFADPAFLVSVQAEALKLKKLVAKELQRLYGKNSKADEQREAVLNGELEWDEKELPKGRDWESEVMVGIHRHPSMNHLHVHVISRDMYSECMKKRRHYNSFTTPFLIDVADFPLAEDDPRRHQKHWHLADMVCWRCGKNFGNKFQRLKEHLAVEFQKWKKE